MAVDTRTAARRRTAGRTTARSRIRVLTVLLIGAVVLVACGAPEFTYVTNSTDHTYLKVPTAWKLIDPKVLDNAIGLDPATTAAQRGLWLQAYDADTSPSPDHVLGSRADSPAVLIAVQDNTASKQGAVSLDGMRDFFYPVSDTARQMMAMSSTGSLTNFALMNDEVVTPGHGVRGVHDVYRYSINGGPPQVFDQTVYANDDASKLYLFYVRCSVECYQQQSTQIKSVVTSFTVRETP